MSSLLERINIFTRPETVTIVADEGCTIRLLDPADKNPPIIIPIGTSCGYYMNGILNEKKSEWIVITHEDWFRGLPIHNWLNLIWKRQAGDFEIVRADGSDFSDEND